METEDNRPKWMIELENRKRKPRLAHEAGAGSPCLTCEAGCPGLDLHFWRKICKNCKCSRDDHDVDDDEFPQFDLLFGPSGKPKKKSIRLRVANKKQKENEVTFDWIPPDTTKELAADYMKALPENKLPIKGSSGAALRRQQLQKQLPLHDVDHKVCDELSEQERQEFEKYLDNLKRYAGQGKVIKIIAARPFSRSLMTPANATDMQRFSPQHKSQLLTNSQMINLRTPSSFVTKLPASSHEALYNQQQTALTPSIEATHNPTSQKNEPDVNSRTGQYHHALFSNYNSGQVAKSVDVSGTYHPEQQQQLASSGKISDNHRLLASKLESSLPTAQNVRFAAAEMPRREIKTSSAKQFAREENVPASDQQRSLKLTRSNASNKNDEYLPAIESTCDQSVPRSTGHCENLQDNVQRAKVPVVGQCYNDQVSSSQSLDDVGRKANAETLMQNRSAALNYAENWSPGSNVLHQEPVILDDLENPIAQNLASLEEFSHETARLAELMLSEALLPPSAVHAKEIIGSTLDKDKLKFIQQQLSAKYSKDDPVAQSTLRSQKLDANDLQHAGTLNKLKGTTKNVLCSSAEREMERTAVIAAVQYPSAIMSIEQNLRQIVPKCSDLSNEGKEIQMCNAGDVEPIESNANTAVGESTANRLFSPNFNSSTRNYNKSAGTVDRCAESPTKTKNVQNPPEGKRQREQCAETVSSIPHSSMISDPTVNQQYLLEHLNNNLVAANSTEQTPNPFRMHRQFTNDLPSISDPSRQFVSANQQSHSSTHPRECDTNTLEQSPERHWNPDNSTMNLQSCRSENSKPNLNRSPFLSGNQHSVPRQLQAELNCQPVCSNVIYSESLQNPVFPEGVVESLELMQNPTSVDRLKGAMEELTEGPVQTQKCHQCHEETRIGDVVVIAEKAKNAVWHPGCFICSVCNELLVDLVYFYHKGKLYCGRDLATHLNIPRCFACDELIFVREYTVAEGHNYHIKHFCCWDCDMPLAGQQYISENDRPLCLPCYQKTYAKTCMTCKKVIAADQQGVAVKNLDFHATDTCFCCFMCKKSLLSGKMGIRENKPFCSKECITKFLNQRP